MERVKVEAVAFDRGVTWVLMNTDTGEYLYIDPDDLTFGLDDRDIHKFADPWAAVAFAIAHPELTFLDRSRS